MATLKTLLLVLFFLSHQKLPSLALTCKKLSCNKSDPIVIRFPFRINQTDQPKRCGYPDFDLECNENGQTIVDIASAGEFVVEMIDYWEPSVTIRDPQGCIANRWLKYNISTPSFVPYQISPSDYEFGSYTFLNCTKNLTSSNFPNVIPIPCLSGDGYTVTALPSYSKISHVPCTVILENVRVPQPEVGSLFSDLRLTWGTPDCKQCEINGGTCRFDDNLSYVLGCSYPSRIVQHFIAAAIVICFVFCFLALVLHVCIMNRSEREHMTNNPNSNRELVAVINPTGLDKIVVDSYPKFIFKENKDVLEQNDNTCSICTSEYQQGEVLKIIPNCKHYFHVDCIDKWLLKNATCPLCRILTYQ